MRSVVVEAGMSELCNRAHQPTFVPIRRICSPCCACVFCVCGLLLLHSPVLGDWCPQDSPCREASRSAHPHGIGCGEHGLESSKALWFASSPPNPLCRPRLQTSTVAGPAVRAMREFFQGTPVDVARACRRWLGDWELKFTCCLLCWGNGCFSIRMVA